MKTSANGIVFIRDLEGCKLKAYCDVGGIWTIGIGHTGKVGPEDAISQAEADGLLALDLALVEIGVGNSVKVALLHNEFDALVSLAFNIGIAAFKYSTLVKYLNLKEFKMATNEFKRWSYVNHAFVQALYERRVKERDLFETGKYVSRETKKT